MVGKPPPPCRHVGGGVGSVTACAGAEPPLRAGAGAGRGAALAAAAWGGRPGRRRSGAALNLTGKWAGQPRLTAPGGRTDEGGGGWKPSRATERASGSGSASATLSVC